MDIRSISAVSVSILLGACATQRPAVPLPAPATVAAAQPVATAAAGTPAPIDSRRLESEKFARQMGYHAELRDTKTYYCRTAADIGSRVSHKECMSDAAMMDLVGMSRRNQADFNLGRGCNVPTCTVH